MGCCNGKSRRPFRGGQPQQGGQPVNQTQPQRQSAEDKIKGTRWGQK